MSLFKSVVAAGLLIGVAAPASATITFATMSTATSERNVHFVEGTSLSNLYSGLAGATSASAVPVNFSIIVEPVAQLTNVAATFVFNAFIPTAAIPASGAFDLSSMYGSFSITSNSAITYKGITGTNLLSGVFTGANIQGIVNSSTGGANLCTGCVGSMVFSSDFLNFSQVQTEAFALNFTSILSGQLNGFRQSQAGSLSSFRASMSGDFASDPLPILVPEPDTWAMLVIGFGLVGVSIRRRRSIVVA
jgi:hypothetical protein